MISLYGARSSENVVLSVSGLYGAIILNDVLRWGDAEIGLFQFELVAQVMKISQGVMGMLLLVIKEVGVLNTKFRRFFEVCRR